MAPYSPLPMGFPPRPPHIHAQHRPFAHIFGQTVPRSPVLISRPVPIICGPESKSWMTCLAFCCFIIVVWIAGLPTSPTFTDDSFLAVNFDLEEATGLGFIWSPDRIISFDMAGIDVIPASELQMTMMYIPVVTDLVKRDDIPVPTPTTPGEAAGLPSPTTPPSKAEGGAASPSATSPSHSTMFDSPPQADQPTAQKTGGCRFTGASRS
jgi:hypothetical protein